VGHRAEAELVDHHLGSLPDSLAACVDHLGTRQADDCGPSDRGFLT